ncbi:unnamed protein product, partial [Discosporangium mesarthrocarpum]
MLEVDLLTLRHPWADRLTPRTEEEEAQWQSRLTLLDRQHNLLHHHHHHQESVEVGSGGIGNAPYPLQQQEQYWRLAGGGGTVGGDSQGLEQLGGGHKPFRSPSSINFTRAVAQSRPRPASSVPSCDTRCRGDLEREILEEEIEGGGSRQKAVVGGNGESGNSSSPNSGGMPSPQSSPLDVIPLPQGGHLAVMGNEEAKGGLAKNHQHSESRHPFKTMTFYPSNAGLPPAP